MRTYCTALALVFLLSPIVANSNVITMGTFEWNDALGDRSAPEAAGEVTGLGTSFATIGIGFPDPTSLEFDGSVTDGRLAADPFTVGSVTVFNGDITLNTPPFVNSLILSLAGLECDDAGLNCVEVNSGEALMSFVFTANTDDPIESADGICIEVVGGDEQCAWQLELSTQSFDIVAAFGSLIVHDLIPTTPGAFVTLGRDPTQRIIRQVPEPTTLGLFALGFLGICLARQRRMPVLR